MAAHVASRALGEFPSGLQHEMVGVERAYGTVLYTLGRPGVSELIFSSQQPYCNGGPAPTTGTLAMGER
jgi:hypothetical protein